jgi:hypothetical protein
MEVDGGELCGELTPEEASIEALMWHPSDAGVKPIVANRRIERLPEPRWEARTLGFPALTLEQMMALPQAEKEQFLTQVYRCALRPACQRGAWRVGGWGAAEGTASVESLHRLRAAAAAAARRLLLLRERHWSSGVAGAWQAAGVATGDA